MPPTFILGLPLSRRDILFSASASALAASFAFPQGNAHAVGLATHDVPEGEHTMGFVTTDERRVARSDRDRPPLWRVSQQ